MCEPYVLWHLGSHTGFVVVLRLSQLPMCDGSVLLGSHLEGIADLVAVLSAV